MSRSASARPHLVVDPNLCQRDGACADTCPVSIIELGPEGPRAVERLIEHCVRCGHCLAVCPHGALELVGISRRTLLPLRRDELPAPEQVERLLVSRRSIRAFQPQPVPEAMIERLILATSHAPSGHNRHPVEWTVVSGSGHIQALSEAVIAWLDRLEHRQHPLASQLGAHGLVARARRGEDPILRRAPHVILAHTAASDPLGPAECTIAMTYLQVAAWGLGLGTCWAGFLQLALGLEPEVARLVALPPGHAVHAATMLGHPRHAYVAVPPRPRPQIHWG